MKVLLVALRVFLSKVEGLGYGLMGCWMRTLL